MNSYYYILLYLFISQTKIQKTIYNRIVAICLWGGLIESPKRLSRSGHPRKQKYKQITYADYHSRNADIMDRNRLKIYSRDNLIIYFVEKNKQQT